MLVFPYFLQFQNSSAQETYTFFWYHRDILPKSNKGNNQTHLLYCKPPSFIKFLFSSHIRSCTGCWCFRDVLTRKDTLNAYSVLVSLWAGCFVFKVRVRSKKVLYTKRNAQRSFYSPLTTFFWFRVIFLKFLTQSLYWRNKIRTCFKIVFYKIQFCSLR